MTGNDYVHWLFGFLIDELLLLSLSDLSNIISIVTAIVLVVWFRYSRKSYLAENYFKEITGKYGGFTEAFNEDISNGGILLRILEIDANGYFIGEVEYGEVRTFIDDNRLVDEQIRDGVYTCIGLINHKFKREKKRHPMKVKENRKYKGKFYIVTRLDYEFNKYNFDQYVHLEYNLIHNREMNVLELQLVKSYDTTYELPKKMTLHKSRGLSFDVYDSVKFSSFTERYRN